MSSREHEDEVLTWGGLGGVCEMTCGRLEAVPSYSNARTTPCALWASYHRRNIERRVLLTPMSSECALLRRRLGVDSTTGVPTI